MSDAKDLVLKDLTPLIYFVNSELNERERRLALGFLVLCFKHGASKIICSLSGASNTTVTQGKKEALALLNDKQGSANSSEPGDNGADSKKDQPADAAPKRIRAAGGGRKKLTDTNDNLVPSIKAIIDESTVGNPESPLLWTTKSLRNIQDILDQQYAIKVSHTLIGDILRDEGYSLQQNKKYLEAGDPGHDRDAQFKFISTECISFMQNNQPVVSIDAKKKELVGLYKNGGSEYCPKGCPILVNDHDFPSAEGKAVPYGIYDIFQNEGFVNAGIGADTAEFAVNSLEQWWNRMGKDRYPDATKLLITADGGGSNGRRNRLFKKMLQEFADKTGLEVHVCHFPPGTSKWNKIEHRMFSYISMNWRGKPLETYEIIINLIGNTTTKEGLRVVCALDSAEYKKGIKVTDEEFKELNLFTKEWHGEWNYFLKPKS